MLQAEPITLTDSEKEEILKAVHRAYQREGGLKAVLKRLKASEKARKRFDAERKKLIRGIPKHWVAMGPDGMITHMPVMEKFDGSHDYLETIGVIMDRVKKLEGEYAGYYLGYLDPGPKFGSDDTRTLRRIR